MRSNQTLIDYRPEGSMLLKATMIAELARAQHIAQEPVACGAIASVLIYPDMTKYASFPLYTLDLMEHEDGPNAA